MIKYTQEITFEQAKKLAEDSAITIVGSFRSNCEIPVLSEQFVEAECCWFFFRNRQIEIPNTVNLRSWAYAVSKKGHVRLIVDFSDDPPKLKEYLEKFSEHLRKNNE